MSNEIVNQDELIHLVNCRLIARVLNDNRPDIWSGIDRVVFDNSVKAEVDFIYDFLRKEGKLPEPSSFLSEFPLFDWNLHITSESFDYLIEKVIDGYKVRGLFEIVDKLRS